MHVQKNIFIIYSPKAVTVEPATSTNIDIEIKVFLPENSRCFITSVLTENEIHELFSGKHCLWVEILNKSFENTIKIKRNKPLGFLVAEPEHLKFHYVPSKKKTMANQKRKSTSRRQKRQRGGFLSRYDFAYATINQAPKMAPGVIRAAINDINIIAKERISQIIPQGAKGHLSDAI